MVCLILNISFTRKFIKNPPILISIVLYKIYLCMFLKSAVIKVNIVVGIIL